MLVEIVSGVGIEFENFAVRIQRALKFFEAGESLLQFRGRGVLAHGRNGYKQRKRTDNFIKRRFTTGLLVIRGYSVFSAL